MNHMTWCHSNGTQQQQQKTPTNRINCSFEFSIQNIYLCYTFEIQAFLLLFSLFLPSFLPCLSMRFNKPQWNCKVFKPMAENHSHVFNCIISSVYIYREWPVWYWSATVNLILAVRRVIVSKRTNAQCIHVCVYSYIDRFDCIYGHNNGPNSNGFFELIEFEKLAKMNWWCDGGHDKILWWHSPFARSVNTFVFYVRLGTWRECVY